MDKVDKIYYFKSRMIKFDKACDERYSSLLSKLNMEYLPTQEPVFIRQHKGWNGEEDALAIIRNLDADTEMNYVTVAYGKLDKEGNWTADTNTNTTNITHFSVPFWKDDSHLTSYTQASNIIQKEAVRGKISYEKLIGVLPESDLENIRNTFDTKKDLKFVFSTESDEPHSLEAKAFTGEIASVYSLLAGATIVQE